MYLIKMIMKNITKSKFKLLAQIHMKQIFDGTQTIDLGTKFVNSSVMIHE